MNELTTTETNLDVQIARESAAFELLQRQAKMLASSTLVPKDFQNNVANCGIAINIARRLQADPFMVTQNVDVIHGRPSFRASFLIAMVNSSGRFTPLQFRMEGEGLSRSCVAHAKDKASGDAVEGPLVSMAMAKAEGWSTKTGSKWVTMPELMLRYRAAAFFARLYAPDITLGMHTAEELYDTAPIRDVTPPKAEASKLFQALTPVTAAVNPSLVPAGGADETAAAFTLDPSPRKVVLTQDTIASTKKDEPLVLESTPPNRREILASKLVEHALAWSDINDMLLANGLLDEAREVLADCSDDELVAIGANWPSILKIAKEARK